VTTSLRLGALRVRDRNRVAQILDATAVFRPDEISVALELFDEGVVTAAGEMSSANVAPATSSGSSAPADADYVFLGAFTPEDELVAYACYGPTPATDRTWDLYWIAVHPTAQGTGGGTHLLSEVERRLKEHDARMLVVETSSRPEYDATRGFYRARGYAEAARLKAFYAPDDDRVILTKRFQEPQEGGAACHE
jgi:ribosomal protein S18 acetylase RimI-like enzyme